MMGECIAYRDHLLRLCGPPPDGARLVVKWSVHELATLADVVCYYDENNTECEEYLNRMDEMIPSHWDL
jgi:hypothetical protein